MDIGKSKHAPIKHRKAHMATIACTLQSKTLSASLGCRYLRGCAERSNNNKRTSKTVQGHKKVKCDLDNYLRDSVLVLETSGQEAPSGIVLAIPGSRPFAEAIWNRARRTLLDWTSLIP